MNKKQSAKDLIRHMALAFVLTVTPDLITAQSTLSQNMDGFSGENMDGFMNVDPDKDSTVIERTVSKEYFQWTINTRTGLNDIIEPDTIHHSFQNAHLTEGMLGTTSLF